MMQLRAIHNLETAYVMLRETNRHEEVNVCVRTSGLLDQWSTL